MKNDINIDSFEWCDVVFEGRNKNYGAYHLRQTSSKRHIAAFLAIIVLMAMVVVIPNMVSAVKNLEKEDLHPIVDTATLLNIPIEQQIPEENITRKEQDPPPPPLKSSIRFTPPVISKENEVNADNEMKSVSDILDTKITVSMADIKGTDEKFGVTIDELKDHTIIVEQETPKTPFTNVEQMPTFMGGEKELMAFISKNLKYPVSAQENGIQGRVSIRFVVTATGDISDVKILRGIDPACDKEAVRVVKSMPKWIPGKQNGRNVAVYFTLPIIFTLNN